MAKKSEPAKTEKWGAQYLNAKLAVEVGAPPVYAGITGKTLANVEGYFKAHGLEYLQGDIVAAVDRWGSKRIGQAAALSRNSVTAMIGEGLPLIQSYATTKGGGLLTLANDAVARQDGFSMADGSFDVSRTKHYAFVKYGLGIGRKIANKTRIIEPVKKGLAMVGLTL